MPGADEQEEEDHGPESGNEDREQRVDHPPPEPERPEDQPELAPLDVEVAEDIEPLAPEAKMRRDLRAEATSLRHLLLLIFPRSPIVYLANKLKCDSDIHAKEHSSGESTNSEKS